MNLKIVLLSAAAALAMSSVQADAGIHHKRNWTGFHAGVIGGKAWGTSNIHADIAGMPEDGAADLQGSMLGGVVGYDHQMDNSVVLGILGDFSLSDIHGWACVHQAADLSCGTAPDTIANVNLNWLATARGRIGIANDDAMIYATGGLAIAGMNISINHAATPAFIGSDSHTQFGWTIGAGVQYRISDPVTLGLEYLYVDLGKSAYNFSSSPSATGDVSTHISIVRATLEWRF